MDLPDFTGTPWRRRGARNRPPARLYPCVLCPSQADAWDHCHQHDRIRGPLCNRDNRIMTNVDAGLASWATPERLAHRARCPNCTDDLPPPAQWVIDDRARSALASARMAGGSPGPCAWCQVVQAISGVPYANPSRTAILASVCRRLNGAA